MTQYYLPTYLLLLTLVPTSFIPGNLQEIYYRCFLDVSFGVSASGSQFFFSGYNQKIDKGDFFKLIRVRFEKKTSIWITKCSEKTGVWNLVLDYKVVEPFLSNVRFTSRGSFFLGATRNCAKDSALKNIFEKKPTLGISISLKNSKFFFLMRAGASSVDFFFLDTTNMCAKKISLSWSELHLKNNCLK